MVKVPWKISAFAGTDRHTFVAIVLHASARGAVAYIHRAWDDDDRIAILQGNIRTNRPALSELSAIRAEDPDYDVYMRNVRIRKNSLDQEKAAHRRVVARTLEKALARAGSQTAA